VLTMKEMLSAGAVVIAVLLAAGWFLFGDRTRHQSAIPAKEWGDAYIKNGPVLGCRYEADLKRVLVQGHTSAATLMMNPLVDSHRCVMFDDNEKVFIEHAASANLIAVRRPGEPDAYWTMSERVRIE
jgi:hypothetical protein